VKDLVEELRLLLGPDGCLGPGEDLSAYEQGWRYGAGRALAVARPRNTEEVQGTLRAAFERGVSVQPIGANTGLVGASTPDSSGAQLVLALERLNRTIAIDPDEASVLVDAGVRLSALQEALRPHRRWFPIDLGADPQIGGMVATNTGGTRRMRYGDVRQNVLGLEVVLADGTCLEGLSPLFKDNTGLDWKQLFIGTGAFLGVVTRARLALAPLPAQRTAVLVAARSGPGVLSLLRHLETELGELLSAFEVISKPALEATLRHTRNAGVPFGSRIPAFAILVELSASFRREDLDLDDRLETTFARFLEAGEGHEIEEVYVGPAEEWWAMRHQLSESLRRDGEVMALDLSVPRAALPAFHEQARCLVKERYPFVRPCTFGHWGDGGVHFNLVWDTPDAPADPRWKHDLQSRLAELCVELFGGSYSAEHGIGPHNWAHYDRWTAPAVRDLCSALKRVLDPERRLGTVRLD